MKLNPVFSCIDPQGKSNAQLKGCPQPLSPSYRENTSDLQLGRSTVRGTGLDILDTPLHCPLLCLAVTSLREPWHGPPRAPVPAVSRSGLEGGQCERVGQQSEDARKDLGILKRLLTLLLCSIGNVVERWIPFQASSAFLSRAAISEAAATSALAMGASEVRGPASVHILGPRVGPGRPAPS